MRVPPLPARAKEGLPFACMACGKWVTITTNRAWKQHIYGDLEPWICLEEDCIFAIYSFPTRNDWISHLALDHEMGPKWCIIECPLCRIEVGPGKVSITRHISDHLEEICLSALPVDCDFNDEYDGSELDGEDKTTEKVNEKAWLNELESSDVHGIAETAPEVRNVYEKWISPCEKARRNDHERLDGTSRFPSPFGGGNSIMATLTEQAKGDPQLLDLIKRVAIPGAPKDDLCRLQTLIDQAPEEELGRFQEFIDQITADNIRKGVLNEASTAQGEPVVSNSDIQQRKEGIKSPQSLGSTSSASTRDKDATMASFTAKVGSSTRSGDILTHLYIDRKD